MSFKSILNLIYTSKNIKYSFHLNIRNISHIIHPIKDKDKLHIIHTYKFTILSISINIKF